MKQFKFMSLFIVATLVSGCAAIKQPKKAPTSLPSLHTTSIVTPQNKAMHRTTKDYTLKSIRDMINMAEADSTYSVDNLLEKYRILDTLQQEKIKTMEANERKVRESHEWVEWIQQEDSTVFFRNWKSAEIPSFAQEQVKLYMTITEVHNSMDSIEIVVAKVIKDNSGLSDENMRPVILNKIDGLMKQTERLLTRIEKMNPEQHLTIEQYTFYRKNADRYNDCLKYYD